MARRVLVKLSGRTAAEEPRKEAVLSDAPALAIVLGTRPEAIKLAPVILLARRDPQRLRPLIISTGQQSDMIGPALSDFALAPDIDLQLMQPGQSLSQLTSRCLAGIARVLEEIQPRMVVVQGDTASALAGAMAGFFQKIPVAHVEAGLRTHDPDGPFPEEANRQMISRLTRLHFAPTANAKANLLAEGIDPETIEVTGNTVVDALKKLAPQIQRTPPPAVVSPGQKLVLVTAHRRENFGRPLENICSSIRGLAEQRPELHFVFITHPNPTAAQTTRERLANRPNITLLAPLPYLEMLRLVSDAWLILTDSGGLQEEAPSFHRPVFVLRERTERTEGIACGAARLVGTDRRRIMREVSALCDSPSAYDSLVATANPYGDGQAAARIVAAIHAFLNDPHQAGKVEELQATTLSPNYSRSWRIADTLS